MCGEALVDEVAQVLANHLAALPVGDAEVAHGILGKAVERFAKGLVIDFLPHRQQPFRRRGFRERDRGHAVLLDCSDALISHRLTSMWGAGLGGSANIPSFPAKWPGAIEARLS